MISSNVGAASSLAGRNPSASNGANTAGKTDFDSILASFRDEAFKTPAERARDAVLKKHGLTEDQYQHLPQKARDAIDKEIAEAVRRALKCNATAASDRSAAASQVGGAAF